MYRLVNRVRDYAWGSPTAIPDLLGVPADGKPQAELWIGAHPSAPSATIDDNGHVRPLDDLIRQDPVGLLGRATVEQFGARLPFLLKVLAADTALSLQVHPDAARAARRFREEEDADIPLDAPERTYKDASPKPELVYAITPFHALCGFRPAAQATRTLKAALRCGASHPALRAVIADLDQPGETNALKAATRRLLTLPPQDSQTLIEDLIPACAHADDPAAAVVADLARQYPADPGVAVSLLLNTVRLDPGQALFLAPGNLHSYLHGVALEIMANSDNVLRGGLTQKHIDVPEFLAVVDFRALPLPLITPEESDSGEHLFVAPTPEFQLSVTRVTAGQTVAWPDREPREILVLAGTIAAQTARRTYQISRGESMFVAAEECPVTAHGDGTMVAATVGNGSQQDADRTPAG